MKTAWVKRRVSLMLLLAGLGKLLVGCQPNSLSAKRESAAPALAAKPLQRLTGIWVAWPIQKNAGSYLMRINSDSTGTFTAYGDRGQAFHKQYGVARYYLSEGPLKVRYRPHHPGTTLYIPNLEVQIEMQDAIFDYELSGDTLREFDKMGYQGSLVRLHTTDTLP